MTSESAREGYRRRTRWPALIIIAILAVATAITWIVVLKPEPQADNSCNTPGAPTSTSSTRGSADTASTGTESSAGTASGTAAVSTDTAGTGSAAETSAAAATTTLGSITDRNTLKDTRPANPATVQLRIVNASSTPGMAKTVTETLRKAGFDSIRDATDDPLYPAADLRCWGEIRYGQVGAPAARTVLIVAPCATLVLDDRFDDTIEFAVGALYTDAGLTPEQQAQLAEIKQASIPPAVLEGVTQAVQPLPSIPPLPTASCPS